MDLRHTEPTLHETIAIEDKRKEGERRVPHSAAAVSSLTSRLLRFTHVSKPSSSWEREKMGAVKKRVDHEVPISNDRDI
jgi:hypothetical protein